MYPFNNAEAHIMCNLHNGDRDVKKTLTRCGLVTTYGIMDIS